EVDGEPLDVFALELGEEGRPAYQCVDLLGVVRAAAELLDVGKQLCAEAAERVVAGLRHDCPPAREVVSATGPARLRSCARARPRPALRAAARSPPSRCSRR